MDKNKRSVSLLPFYDAVGTDATLFPSGERPQQQQSSSSSSSSTTRARAFFNVVLSSSFQSRTNEKIVVVVVCFVNTCVVKKKERKKERKKKKIILFFSLSFLLHSPPKYFCHLEGLTPLVGIETHKVVLALVFWCFLVFSDKKIKK